MVIKAYSPTSTVTAPYSIEGGAWRNQSIQESMDMFSWLPAARWAESQTGVFLTRDLAAEQAIAEYQRDLDEIARLPFGWDTYGSPPVQQAALQASADLLRLSAEEGLPAPHIAPISGGGIHLEWEAPRRSMQFVVGANGEFDYVLYRGEGDVAAEGELPSVDKRHAAAFMSWFMSA